MDPLRGTRTTYDRIAGRFLEKTRSRDSLMPWLDAFAARLPSASLVADVGGGPGFDAAQLRARGLRAVTLDLSLGMLRCGVREFPGPRILADMRALPFAPGSLGGIWASASLLHLERADVGAALAGFRAALQPGGLLHVGVKQGSGAGWETARYGSDEPRFFTYWSEAAFDRELEGAGFRTLEGGRRQGQDTWITRQAVA